MLSARGVSKGWSLSVFISRQHAFSGRCVPLCSEGLLCHPTKATQWQGVPPILALPFLLLPQTSQREDCLFLQGVTFSMVNQMTRKIIQISPPLHPPFFFFFLYEVIYTLGIEHRHCCCSRSVTDTNVTINSMYPP